jgi:hypothetical protein
MVKRAGIDPLQSTGQNYPPCGLFAVLGRFLFLVWCGLFYYVP